MLSSRQKRTIDLCNRSYYGWLRLKSFAGAVRDVSELHSICVWVVRGISCSIGSGSAVFEEERPLCSRRHRCRWLLRIKCQYQAIDNSQLQLTLKCLSAIASQESFKGLFCGWGSRQNSNNERNIFEFYLERVYLTYLQPDRLLANPPLKLVENSLCSSSIKV